MYLTVSMNPTLQKILCFASITIDRVNRSPRHRFDVAGKGLNVCRVLSQLGKPALHLTTLGGDLRPLFLEKSRQEGLSVHWVESGGPIRFCYTLIDEGAGSVTELIENAGAVGEGAEGRLREAYEKLLADCGIVVIAGTKAPGFSDEIVPFMVRRAREKGRRVVLDLWGKDLLNSLPYNPDVIKPNLLEFAATFAPELTSGGELPGEDAAAAAVKEAAIKEAIFEICGKLCAEYRCGIVLTRGAKPVWLFSDGVPDEYPVAPLPGAVNTTGSGDAFTAGLASVLDAGLRAAVAEGARCGALNARFLQVGTIRG
ncbi:MAG: PfkB family carbohydrate kinase [Spirochaetaceae bacterium]|jgi:fructose-1-phosphate kinase PfkB-like protein|nr:PfkB family carbohydrate kinase [Spirochaetaceae bacterium]